jgi:hypothetical protein
LKAQDIHIDVKGSALTVLIVNVSDKCSIRFSDGLKTAPGQEKAWPSGLSVRVESLNGEVLSRTKYMGDWFAAVEQINTMHPTDFSLITVGPGAMRVKLWTIGRLFRGIDSLLHTEGSKGLPWGSQVVLRVKVLVIADPEAAAGRFRGTRSRSVEASTPPFLFTLPKSPYAQ